MSTRKFLKASSILLVGEILTRVIGFIYLSTLQSIDSNIGYISSILMQPYSFFLIFAILGLSNILTANLSKNSNNTSTYSKSFFDGLFYILITTIFFSILLFVSSNTLIEKSVSDEFSINTLSNSLKLLSFSIIFYSFNMLLKSLFFSQNKYVVVSITYITEQIFKVVFLLVGCYLIVTKLQYDTIYTAYIISLASLLSIISTTIIMLVYAMKNKFFTKITFKDYKFTLKTFINLLTLGSVYFINGIFISGINQIDLLRMVPDLTKYGLDETESLNVLGIYFQWTGKIISLIIALASVFVSMMVNFVSKSNDENKHNQFVSTLKLLFLYSLLSSIFLLTVGENFLRWFYPEYNPIYFYILSLQALLLPFYITKIQTSIYVLTYNNKKIIILSTIALFISKIIFNSLFVILLGNINSYLVILAYILSTILSIIISLIILFIFENNIFKISKKSFLYIFKSILKFFIIFIIMTFVSINLLNDFNISNVLLLFIKSSILLVLFAIFYSTDIKQLIK